MSSDKDSLRSVSKARVVDAVCEGEIEGLVAGMQSIYLDGTPLQNANGTNNFTDVTPPEIRTGTRTQSRISWSKGTEAAVSVGVEVKQATPIERTITDSAADAARVTMSFPQLMQQQSNGDLKGVTVQYRIAVKPNGGSFTNQLLDFEWVRVASGQGVTSGTTPTGTTKIQVVVAGQTTLAASASTSYTGSPRESKKVAAVVQWRQVGTTSWTTAATFTVMASVTNSFSQLDASSGLWRGQLGSVEFAVPNGPAYEVQLQISTGLTAVWLTPMQALVQTDTVTVTGKSSSAYQRSHLVSLPAGGAPWIVRVERVTPDATSTTVQDKTIWDSLTSIYEEKLNHPHTALVGLAFDARQFSSIPQRSYHLRLLKVKVPSNYDPIARTYSGDWNGTFKVAWTNNPVWCWYDLATSIRYGAGDFITEDMLDKWALYQMAQYCDGLVPDGRGGLEPRFTCNLYLQTREDAFKVLTNMAAIFRAMTFWGAGTVNLAQDAPQTPAYLFTNANVADGTFGYSSSNIKARHNVALVAWNDPSERFRQKVEYVDDPELIVRWGFVAQTEVVALGCTSRAQAYRVGRWLLYTERYETESVVFETGLEGNIPRPGQVIEIADQHRAGARIGGRLLAVPTATTVQLDQAVTLTAGATYTLSIINDDGGVEDRTVTTAEGTTDTLTLASAWTVAPSAESIWILSSTLLQPELYRVLDVREKGNGERFAISAVLYNPGKHDYVDLGALLPERNTSILGDPFEAPPSPDGLDATDSIYVDAAKLVRSRITLSWQPVLGKFVRGYLPAYRLADGGWQDMAETSQSSVDILDVKDGQPYELRVYSISQTGLRSDQPALITYTPLGKARPPSDVASITATINNSNGQVDLTWPAVPDLDVTLYEVRQGLSWDSGAVVFSGLGTTATVQAAGTAMTFWVRAKDAERYSDNSAAASITIQVPLQPSILVEVIDNNVLLRWTNAQQSLPVDYYEIRRGAVFASATVIGTKAGLFTTVFESQGGSYTYWVVGIDRAGNYGTPGSVPATVSAPPDYVLQLAQTITWDTYSNAANESAGAILPVNTTETFAAHFTANSWTTPQDQVTAGFPVYVQPGLTTGFVEDTIDAGGTLPSSKITVSFSALTVSGTPSVSCTISVSNTSATGPWTDYAGVQSVYATAFRWVKVRLTVTGGIARIQSPSIRLDVKEKGDSGEANAVSTDVGGTTVNFTVAFASVKSISLTPKGTAARIAIYDFAGGVNPTSFKILLFDTTGTRVSGAVGWSASGV